MSPNTTPGAATTTAARTFSRPIVACAVAAEVADSVCIGFLLARIARRAGGLIYCRLPARGKAAVALAPVAALSRGACISVPGHVGAGSPINWCGGPQPSKAPPG